MTDPEVQDMINEETRGPVTLAGLRRCPFCGGEPVRSERRTIRLEPSRRIVGSKHKVMCKDCKIATPEKNNPSIADMAWNRRTGGDR